MLEREGLIEISYGRVERIVKATEKAKAIFMASTMNLSEKRHWGSHPAA